MEEEEYQEQMNMEAEYEREQEEARAAYEAEEEYNKEEGEGEMNMKEENNLKRLGVILCEKCNNPVGDKEAFKKYLNPIVRFICSKCMHKTDKKNPYFSLGWRKLTETKGEEK